MRSVAGSRWASVKARVPVAIQRMYSNSRACGCPSTMCELGTPLMLISQPSVV